MLVKVISDSTAGVDVFTSILQLLWRKSSDSLRFPCYLTNKSLPLSLLNSERTSEYRLAVCNSLVVHHCVRNASPSSVPRLQSFLRKGTKNSDGSTVCCSSRWCSMVPSHFTSLSQTSGGHSCSMLTSSTNTFVFVGILLDLFALNADQSAGPETGL